jgi:hypothetical protein
LSPRLYCWIDIFFGKVVLALSCRTVDHGNAVRFRITANATAALLLAIREQVGSTVKRLHRNGAIENVGAPTRKQMEINHLKRFVSSLQPRPLIFPLYELGNQAIGGISHFSTKHIVLNK